MGQLEKYLRNNVKMFYRGNARAYWDGQSPREERVRRLVHLAWKFGVDLEVFLVWAREKGSAIEQDPDYWRAYQWRYLAPRFPEGYGLRGSDGSDFYLVRDGCICRRRREQDGDVVVPLGNFEARIVEAIVADDGVGT